MKTPKQILPLIDDGLVDNVVGALMSGKEASVYIVNSESELRCAKVYKDAIQRSFKKATQYREGRKVRNSRRARAMEKGSKFGRTQQENEWQNAEVNALYKLADIGVRVPKAYGCFDGVLLMELILDADGEVAPRLNDITMSAELARLDHELMMRNIMLMLCAGIVHGDLSEFNVLVDASGPVIIDLPQAVDAAANNHAKRMLIRDVENITNYYGQYAPELLETQYAQEMWQHFENGELTPEIELTGIFEADEHEADVDSILEEIKVAYLEEQARLERIAESDE
jgi:RIO kinase 1